MSTQEKDQVCVRLVEKLSSGRPLDGAEEAHMVECESCMLELVRRLDQAAETASVSPEKNGDSGKREDARSRPEARHALEHGRRVFAREFGLS